jgi:hypothetical protein
MYKFVKRFAELYEMLEERYIIYREILWKEYQRMIIPVGPIKFSYFLTKNEAKELLSFFPGALLVRYTEPFNGGSKKFFKWYAVICDEFQHLEDLPSKRRYEIKKGLKNCKVEQIDGKYIARNGYDIFISAFKRYKNTKTPKISEQEFKKRKEILSKFEDIIHFWGVFYKGKLIAYAENYIYDNIEVNYSTIKFHPDFLKLYPSYALFYTMNKYYLFNRKVEYINDGYRNILHQTNIQEFLIRKFKFKKKPLKLHIYMPSLISFILKIAFPFKGIISKLDKRIEALYRL